MFSIYAPKIRYFWHCGGPLSLSSQLCALRIIPFLLTNTSYLGRIFWAFVIIDPWSCGAAPCRRLVYLYKKVRLLRYFFLRVSVSFEISPSHTCFTTLFAKHQTSHTTPSQHAAASFSRITSQISSNCHDHDIIKLQVVVLNSGHVVVSKIQASNGAKWIKRQKWSLQRPTEFQIQKALF